MLISPLNFSISYWRIFIRCMLFWVASLGILYSFMWQRSSSIRTLWVIDTSLSMVTQDIQGNNSIFLSRLDAAKGVILSGALLSHTENALMTFNNTARLQLPFSTDMSTFSSVVKWLQAVIYGGGTDIKAAFSSVGLIYPHEPLHIILITDWENSWTGWIYPEFPLWTRLSVIWVWTTEWWPMLQWYNADGKPRYKQYWGTDAISRLDAPALQAIANKYHGDIFTVANIRDIYGVVDRINRRWQYVSLFSLDWFLYGWALLFLVALFWKPYKVNPRKSNTESILESPLPLSKEKNRRSKNNFGIPILHR